MKCLLTLCVSFFITSPLYAQIQLELGELKDSRSTGEFFSQFEMELSLSGPDASKIHGYRTKYNEALDSAGTDIIPDETPNANGFEELFVFEGQQPRLTLRFKNPARKAELVKSVKGSIEFYVPSKDSDAEVLVGPLSNYYGKALVSPALKKHQIELTLYDEKSYQTMKEQEKKELEKKAVSPQDALKNAFSSFISVKGNDLGFRIVDPAEKIVALQIVGKDKEEIKSWSSMSSNGFKSLSFQEAVPADASVKVLIATEKSIVKVPLDFKDLKLP